MHSAGGNFFLDCVVRLLPNEPPRIRQSCKIGETTAPRSSLALSRLSFRQLLFAAFLLIAVILTAVSVQALLTLEHLASLGRAGAAKAVALTEQSQRLAERTLAMERSARQFLVLDDALFRERYHAAWQQAEAALQALGGAMPQSAPALAAAWRSQTASAWAALQGRQRNAEQTVSAVFARLPAINEDLAREGKREIERRNDALLGELERQRRLLTALVAGAVALAALLAACFGFLLTRPLQRMETAIGLLGEHRYDAPIDVGGPSDTRRLGGQLDWLRQRLAALHADKERFLRHLSHELKTPLAALREGVALLEDEVTGPLVANQHEIVAILRHNTASLQAQIEQLLRYDSAALDARHLERRCIELLPLLQGVIDAQRLQWQARRLRIELDGEPASVAADADTLAVALSNVLSNALRFSPDGGTIRFIVDPVPGGVRIDCIDEGPGVAPGDAARIFEPFYQGTRQAPGARLGNGIGLSIVREYVGAHRGTVTLLPRAAGAHFRIELPL